MANVHGFLLLNKPLGLSSNHALQKVRRLFGRCKAGHSGTLDPLATGMLVIALGEATKFCHYLIEADKAYRATLQLGVETRTGDSEGDVLHQQPVPVFNNEDIEVVLERFRGTFEQSVPAFSAVKHQGEPLYRIALRGEKVPEKRRQVTLSALELLEQTADTLSIRVACTKGTYIRQLGVDIGESLGCGAHISQLHRDWVAGFETAPMVDLDTLTEATDAARADWVLPLSETLPLPVVSLDNQQYARFRQGQPVRVEPQALRSVQVQVSGAFAGVAIVEPSGLLKPRRLTQNPLSGTQMIETLLLGV